MVEVKSILVFCLAGIGDTLFFFPAFRALRAVLPEAHIAALVMFPGARQLLEDNPDADEVLEFEFPREGIARSLRFIARLRRRRFDTVILSYPANRLEYNIVARLLGARNRIGHRYDHYDRLCGNWLNTRSLHERDDLTNIEENLRLVELLTGDRSGDTSIRLTLRPQHTAFAEQWLHDRDLRRGSLVGFHPGGSTFKNHIHKRWPPSRYSELGRLVHDRAGAAILVFGGPEENPIKEEVVRTMGPWAFPVDTPGIFETAALIASCEHFVANDSALLHLAGAMGVPTTAVFGPTNPGWVRIPGVPRKEVTLGLPCQPCFFYSPRSVRCAAYGDFRCLGRLEAGHVAEHVTDALSSAAGRKASGSVRNQPRRADNTSADSEDV